MPNKFAHQFDTTSDEDQILQYAQRYLQAGFCPVPVHPRSKRPIGGGWTSTRISLEDLGDHFFGDRNIGIILGDASGGLVDVDVDSNEAILLATRFLPHTDCIFGRKSKPASHWLYLVTGATKTTKREDDQECIIEVRGTGGQTVFPPSAHKDTGETIEFSLANSDQIPKPAHSDLATLNMAAIKIAVGSVLLKNWRTDKRHGLALAVAGYLAHCGWSEDDVCTLVKAVSESAGDEETKARANDVRTTFENLSAGKKISGIAALRESLGDKAADCIANWVGKPKDASFRVPPSANSNNAITHASFSTDADSGRTFSRFNSQTIRFCSERDQWFVKKDAVFEPVEHPEMQGKVSDLVEHVAKTLPSLDIPKAMRSRNRINATIELSRSHNPVSAEMIDQNKHLVGLSDGKILDLADRIFVYRDDVFVTKKLGAIYDADAKCPLWRAFLDRIFDGNRDVIEFVQRAVGYSLSGETVEQCLFFLLGTGANGKSTFLNGLDRLFGDYAGTRPMQTLTASTFSNGKTNDLAALVGKRLVSASDGESGHKLAENRIKQLTGGDKISCAAMYKDLMTYVPQLKLWIATNDLPNVTGSDEAIMRRIRIVRFPVVIPTSERDQNLSTHLAGEVTGIFNWALQGYSNWKKGGLRPPESVSEATTSYRRDNDLVGQFVEDRCELLPTARASSKILYDNYSGWCDENGHDPNKKVEFGKTLGRKGFKPRKLGGGAAGWSGLQLNPAEKLKATGA